jgi:peroxiredoxin
VGIQGARALDSADVPSMNEPAGARAGSARAGRAPSAVRLIAAVGLAWGLFQGGSALIRAYVDSRIEGRVGEASIDFEVQDTEGRTWRLADLRGRTVVLNFFRSRCVGCLAERDAIRALAQRIDPERAVLLGVLVDRVQGFDAATTEATLARMGYSHPILVADTAFADAFHGAGWSHVTPVTYVLDGEGRITASLRGHQELDALITALPAGTVSEPAQSGSGR